MKKAKLLFSVIGMCLSLAVLTFGVFAATEVSYALSGTIAYNVKDAYVSIVSNVYQYTTGELTRAQFTTLGNNVVEGTENNMPAGLVKLNKRNTYSTQDNSGSDSYSFGALSFSTPDTAQDTGAYAYFFVINVSNLSPSVNVWAVDCSELNIANTMVYSNESQDTIANGSPKNIVIGITVEDWKVGITQANLNMSVNIGAGNSPGTRENIMAQEPTNQAKLIFTYNNDYSTYSVKINPSDTTGEVYIPTSFNGYPVTTIDSCDTSVIYNYTKIYIPGSIRTISTNAFVNCVGITELTIPNGVQTVGNWAFMNCTALQKITLSGTITSITTNAFQGCSNITVLEVTKAMTSSIRTVIINTPSIRQVILEYGITSLPNDAFYNCSNITSVVIPDTVTAYGTYAFRGCNNLKGVKINEGPTTITGLFYQSGVKNITLPDSIITIGVNAFTNCSLNWLVVGTNVTTLINSAFLYTSIGKLYYKGTAEQFANISIGDNTNFTNAERYYYSAVKPDGIGNYWRYVDGAIVEW